MKLRPSFNWHGRRVKRLKTGLTRKAADAEQTVQRVRDKGSKHFYVVHKEKDGSYSVGQGRFKGR